MFCLFSSKSRTVLGVDIVGTSIRVVVITSRLEGDRIQCYLEHYADIGFDAISKGVVDFRKTDLYPLMLRQLLSELPCSYDGIVMAIPIQDTSVHILHCQSGLSNHKIEKWVQQQIVLSANEQSEPYFDFKILGESTRYVDQIDIELIIANTQSIQKKLDLMSELDCSVDVIETETHTLARILPWIAPQWVLADNRYFMLIKIEINRLEVWIFCQIKYIFFHKEYLSDTGVLHSMDYQIALIDYVKKSMDLFVLNHMPVRIDMIFLMGEGAIFNEAEDLFERHFSIPTQLVNPFANMSFSKSTKMYRRMDTAKFVMAAGLALRWID